MKEIQEASHFQIFQKILSDFEQKRAKNKEMGKAKRLNENVERTKNELWKERAPEKLNSKKKLGEIWHVKIRIFSMIEFEHLRVAYSSSCFILNYILKKLKIIKKRRENKISYDKKVLRKVKW